MRFLELLSSVRFGVSLLVLLVLASMVGMLIMQQEVDGFAKYYAALTPAQQLLYGSLGFFDIYHAWYFNALLLVLSLNIILASIDRFPQAWTFISRPKLDASAAWLRGQPQHAEFQMPGASRASVAAEIAQAWRSTGLKPVVSEKGNRTFIFAQRNAWNRLGAYAVHVALLTIFTGGFLTSQFGRTGQMPLAPGDKTREMSEVVFNLDEPSKRSVELPFEVTCTDIQQKLIKKDGGITANNTIDWLTRIKIKDESGEREALVHMNKPYDYRGYRFFQASFINVGRARNITLRLTPAGAGSASPQDVTIARDGSAALGDGTTIHFDEFLPDFTIVGREATTASGDYANPAAVLTVQTAAGERKRAYAFAQELPDGAPVGAPVAGYKYRLVDFEKVPDAHVLSVQRDPGATVFYIGGALLGLSLSAVFFFSHQRFWALVEDQGGDTFGVVSGANTNRNLQALEDRFKNLTRAVHGQPEEVKQS
ncbi:MAG: cytochrome c biogenesis protein ResB [Pyrinomonadaceae bacterium]